MIINGCIVNENNVDEGILKEFFEELEINDEVENEELAIVGGIHTIYKVNGDDSDFTLETDNEEYRVIHDDDIDKIFEDEAAELYDEDMWREDVANHGTTEGYDDWLQGIIDNADHGEFFASYDGDTNEFGKYQYFRVG